MYCIALRYIASDHYCITSHSIYCIFIAVCTLPLHQTCIELSWFSKGEIGSAEPGVSSVWGNVTIQWVNINIIQIIHTNVFITITTSTTITIIIMIMIIAGNTAATNSAFSNCSKRSEDGPSSYSYYWRFLILTLLTFSWNFMKIYIQPLIPNISWRRKTYLFFYKTLYPSSFSFFWLSFDFLKQKTMFYR